MKKYPFREPTVLLAEHGSTDFSAPGDNDRIHGVKYDLPLTEKGRKEAAQAAEKLRDYDIASLEHSPMLRAKQTARMIGDATGITPKSDERLKPWDSGYLSGMTHGAVKERVRYYIEHPHKPVPEGQSYGEWFASYAEKLASKLSEAKRTPGKAHVMAVHSSEVTTAPAVIKGDPEAMVDERLPGAGKIAALVHRNGKWRYEPEWKG